MTRGPQRMIVAAYNYTPEPTVSPVKRAVSLGFDYQADKNAPPHWYSRTLRWGVDGVHTNNMRLVAARLREVPVIVHVNAFHHEYVTGAPLHFSTASLEWHRQALAAAYRQVTGWFSVPPGADWDRFGAINVPDIFAFLSDWFTP